MDDHTSGIAVIESTSYGSSFAPCSIRWGNHPEKDGHDYCLVMLNDIDIELYEGEIFPIEYFAFEEKNKIVCFMTRPLTRCDDYLGPIEVKVYLSGLGYKSLKTGIDKMGTEFKNRWSESFVSDWESTIEFPERCALCLNAEDPPLEDGHGVGKCVPPPMIDYSDFNDYSDFSESSTESTSSTESSESPPTKRPRLETDLNEYAHYCCYCNQLTRGYVCDTCLEEMENEYENESEEIAESEEIGDKLNVKEPKEKSTKKGWFSWIW